MHHKDHEVDRHHAAGDTRPVGADSLVGGSLVGEGSPLAEEDIHHAVEGSRPAEGGSHQEPRTPLVEGNLQTGRATFIVR